MANGQVTWTVTDQNSGQSDFTSAGQVVIGKRVFFLTGAGNRGSVFVPDDHYNPGTVAAMIAAEAAQLDAISALTSDYMPQGQ